MNRTLLRAVSLGASLFVAVLSGCNYDPETRLFRQIAPKPEDVVLQPPGAEGQASENSGNTAQQAMNHCEQDSLRCHAQNIASGLNGITFFMLTIVDAIVQQPPSHRETGRRVWGPHFDRDNGNTFRFEMTRDDDDGFSWCLHVGAGDLRLAGGMRQIGCETDTADNGMLRLMSGNLLPGDVDGQAARSGSGTMLLEALRLLELRDDPDILGTFSFVYDNRSGQQIQIHIADVPEEAGNPFRGDATYEYTRSSEGDGTFSFAARSDFVGSGDFGFASEREDFLITAQWRADKAGRADATISGGDLAENESVEATQCWDTALVTTYSHNTHAPDEAEGDAADCVFQERLAASGS